MRPPPPSPRCACTSAFEHVHQRASGEPAPPGLIRPPCVWIVQHGNHSRAGVLSRDGWATIARNLRYANVQRRKVRVTLDFPVTGMNMVSAFQGRRAVPYAKTVSGPHFTNHRIPEFGPTVCERCRCDSSGDIGCSGLRMRTRSHRG